MTTTVVPYSAADLDQGGVDHRFGLIALSTDIATEPGFQRMLPPGVMFHTARVPQFNPVTPDNLRRMEPYLGEAARLIADGNDLDAIAYSCTSATVSLGFPAVEKAIQAGRSGVAVVTPITAAVEACHQLGIKRLALLTPYLEVMNTPTVAYLGEQGIEVVGVCSFHIADDVTMGRLHPEVIQAAALRHCPDNADGLFIPCTALRATGIIAPLEEALGRPVLTSIQALFWAALRQSGYRGAVTGYGQLLSTGSPVCR